MATTKLPTEKFVTYLTPTLELKNSAKSNLYTWAGPCEQIYFLNFYTLSSCANGSCEASIFIPTSGPIHHLHFASGYDDVGY